MKVKTRIKMVDKMTWVFLINSINYKQSDRIVNGRYYV